jgi:aspartate aminotransferase
MKFSNRALAVSESETLRLSNLATRLRQEGRDIISFLEGEPDLPTPESVIEATIAALRAGYTRYSSSTGLAELKSVIVEKLRRDNNIAVTVDNILVANGAKQVIYEVLQALCGPGDEVIVPQPCWVTFPEAVKLAGAQPIAVNVSHDHQLDLDALQKAITSKTKAIIINTPNNPTGAVYGEDSLHRLVDLAQQHDLVIIADEAYEALIFDGQRHISIASLSAQAAARTVTIQTCSKSFSMTGFRIGYMAAPPEITRAVARIHSHVTGNACTFSQYGAISALKLGPEHRQKWCAAHELRRDVAFTLARALFDCVKPEGGLFLFADVRRHLGARFKNSATLAHHFLESAGVATVPGEAFGREGYLRLSFSASENVLRDGYARIKGSL